MKDDFKTIKRPCRTETKQRGSRFIATALPVSTKADVEQFLEGIREEFRDATHHCFACRFGTDGTMFRYNDDGEPAGSAGKPILAAIDKFGVTDILVVVTRYFGGTKLGVGGLRRAYGEAAERALSQAVMITKYKLTTLEATFPHTHISNVMHVVSTLGVKIVDTAYDEDVHMRLEVRLSHAEELTAALRDQTRGNVSVKAIH
jgi:uncharacterized YigZ family protein